MREVQSIPAEASAAALARALALSERRVAAVKAEGRLPTTPAGRIDLHGLLRRGWAACLAGRGEPGAFPEVTAEERAALGILAPAAAFTDLHDRGFAAAALLALHEAPISAAIALAEVGTPRAETERACNLLLLLLWGALNRRARGLGVPDSGADGPLYFEGDDALAWRDAVRWSALFGPDGRSLVAGQMAADAAAERAAGEACEGR